MSYIRQHAFSLARNLAFWPLCNFAYHILVVGIFSHYLCISYWAISTQYNNWDFHSLVVCTAPYLCCAIIGPVTALLFVQTFGRSAFMSFGLSQPCCTIIGPVVALLHVSSSIVLVASNRLYLRSTLLW